MVLDAPLGSDAVAVDRRRRRHLAERFLDHGTIAQVRAEIGLTAQEVARRVVEHIARLEPALPDTHDSDDRQQSR